MKFVIKSSAYLPVPKARWVTLPSWTQPRGVRARTHIPRQLTPESTFLAATHRQNCFCNTDMCSESPLNELLIIQQLARKTSWGVWAVPSYAPSPSKRVSPRWLWVQSESRWTGHEHHRQKTFHLGSLSPHWPKLTCSQSSHQCEENHTIQVGGFSLPKQTQVCGWERGVGAKAIGSHTVGHFYFKIYGFEISLILNSVLWVRT